MPQQLSSKANPRVRALRAALAGRVPGMIGVEGPHLVHEAVRSGLQIQTLVLRADKATLGGSFQGGAAVETLLLSEAAFSSAATTEHAQGVAAVLAIPTAAYAPRSGDLLLVADGLQDPGNLGTLIRSAEAFGAAAVALTRGTVSPWNGKCLRAAAGAAFRLPLPTWSSDLLAGLRTVGARLYAAVAHGGRPAHAETFADTTVLVVGSEGAGVSQGMLDLCDSAVTLATPGPTESLNAAVAGSLLLYQAAQQRTRSGL